MTRLERGAIVDDVKHNGSSEETPAMTTQTPQADPYSRDVAEEIATEQIRTVHRTIELLRIAQSMVNSGMSATSGETEVVQTALSKAIETLRSKRDRELDTRLTWQRRDWLATSLNLGSGDTAQRRAGHGGTR